MTIMTILLVLLYVLISLAIPVAIIVLIVRAVTRRRVGSSGANNVTPEQLIVTSALLPAALVGVGGMYLLPTALLGLSEGSATFAIRLVSGLVLLLLGLPVAGMLRYLLMALGIIILLSSTQFLFSSFGSVGVLLVVFLVLVSLVIVSLKLAKKEPAK